MILILGMLIDGSADGYDDGNDERKCGYMQYQNDDDDADSYDDCSYPGT